MPILQRKQLSSAWKMAPCHTPPGPHNSRRKCRDGLNQRQSPSTPPNRWQEMTGSPPSPPGYVPQPQNTGKGTKETPGENRLSDVKRHFGVEVQSTRLEGTRGLTGGPR